MFPHEKQNLVPYRFILTGSVLCLIALVVFGVLTEDAYGLFFAFVHVIMAALIALRAFRWSPEPTAKRQFAVGFLVVIVLGLAGAVLTDVLTNQYFLVRGDCIDRLWVTFQCDRQGG